MDIVLNRNAPRGARGDGAVDDSAKPPMGGWLPGIAFTPVQVRVLNAFADQLIPPAVGYPAPSDVDVVAFFARYLFPLGVEPRWYPFIGESRFRDWLDSLGEEFAQADSPDQIEVVAGVERSEPEFFGIVRDLTYYAYYSRPGVIAAINRELEAGKDLRNAPQPYGYSATTEEWDEQLFGGIAGSYTRTQDVARVPIPEALQSTSSEGAGE
jgi:hypothetical protein